APAGIGFAGSGLGPQHAGDLFVGAARTFLDGGYLFEFKFDHSRQHFAFSDPGLKDRVDDNDYKFDEGQNTRLVAGKNFGIVTDIVTGPDGNLYVTSLSNGAVYMISRKGSAARSAVSGSTLGPDLLDDRSSEPARNSVPRDTSGTAGNDVSSLAGMSPESMSGGDTTLPGKSDGLDVDIPSSSSAGVFGGTTDPETPLTGDESDASAGDSTERHFGAHQRRVHAPAPKADEFSGSSNHETGGGMGLGETGDDPQSLWWCFWGPGGGMIWRLVGGGKERVPVGFSMRGSYDRRSH